MIFLIFTSIGFGVSAQTIQGPPMDCGVDPNEEAYPEQAYRSNAFCSDPEVVKYIRIAYHFMLTDNENDLVTLPDTNFTIGSPGNFTPYSDGLGNSNYTGYDRAHMITNRMNHFLATNHDHWRESSGITYPAIPPDINLQFVVSAVQFHVNSADWNYGYIFTTNKYDYGGDEVIDIYMMPFFTYPREGTSGVASCFGCQDKFLALNSYSSYVNPFLRDWADSFYMPGLLAHELGHSLNLRHSWVPDNCDDTPVGFVYDKVNAAGTSCLNRNANCWKYDPQLVECNLISNPRKPCDTWSKITNNYMDYNGYFYVHAFTECQIGKMQSNLNTFDDYIHSCNDCLPATSYFEVENTCLYNYLDRFGQPVTGGVQINANASYNVDQWYLEICELNSSGNCTGSSYTSPWQSGSPGQMIMTDYYAFQANKTYRVVLTTNKSTCPLNESYQWDLTTQACSSTANPDIDITGGSTIFSTTLNVTYHLNTSGIVDLYAVNTRSTGISFDLLTGHLHGSSGIKSFNFNSSSIQQGNYQVVGIFESTGWGNQVSVDTKTFIKN